MLSVLHVVNNILLYKVEGSDPAIPSKEQLASCTHTLSDIATMSGKDRVKMLEELKIDSKHFPVFLRAIQHLTSVHKPGMFEDCHYDLHRHLSSHEWSSQHCAPLLGYPQVNSYPHRDMKKGNGESQLAQTTSPLSHTSRTHQSNGGNLNGLVNQGATCYLNSLLQSLFHLSAFRCIIYNMRTKEEAGRSNSDTSPKSSTGRMSIPYALQRLFTRLQTSETAVNTTELTASFGWSTSDGFVQHDVHELTHVLLNNLEAKVAAQSSTGAGKEEASEARGSGSDVASETQGSSKNEINELFQGVLENYVSVSEMDYCGTKEELFYDLQLVVKNNKDIYTSFDAFFQVEVLEGKNSYCLERDGERTYHRAEKGVRLKHTPPILLLHLTRFDYSAQLGESKVFNKWAYYHTLDLSKYMPHQPFEATHYTLYSVMVHFGSNTGNGHYYCFLQCGGVWYKFNDASVTPATLKEVFGNNFGGYVKNYWGSEVAHANHAYMLVYIRTSQFHSLLRPISESEIPRHVLQVLSYEDAEQKRLQNELAMEHLYGRIQFVFPDELSSHKELYYRKVSSSLQLLSHRKARFALEQNCLQSCAAFLREKHICTEEDLASVKLWYAAPFGEQPSAAKPRAADGVSSASTASEKEFNVAESILRLSKCIQSGDTVSDVVGSDRCCTVLITTDKNIKILDLSEVLPEPLSGPPETVGESQPAVMPSLDQLFGAPPEPEVQLFHHHVYDPIHLCVIPLGSTVVRRHPNASPKATLKALEPYITERISQLTLDEEEKKYYNHDFKYDEEIRSRRAAGLKKGIPSSGDLHAYPDFRSSLPSSPKQLFPSGSTEALWPTNQSTSESISQTDVDTLFTDFTGAKAGDGQPSSPDKPITATSSFLSSGILAPTSLSVHVQNTDAGYQCIYRWEGYEESQNVCKRVGSEGGDRLTATPPAAGPPASKPVQLSKRRRLHSGEVIVWQAPFKAGDPNVFYPDIVSFQPFARSPVTFSIRLNRPPVCPPLLTVTLSEVMTYEQLQRYVARLIGEPDYDRIRFSRYNPDTEQPYFMKGNKLDVPLLRNLLSFSLYRVTKPSPFLFYERCKFPVSSIESGHSLQFQLFSDNVKPVSSHWILLSRDVPLTKNNFFKAVVEEIRADFCQQCAETDPRLKYGFQNIGDGRSREVSVENAAGQESKQAVEVPAATTEQQVHTDPNQKMSSLIVPDTPFASAEELKLTLNSSINSPFSPNHEYYTSNTFVYSPTLPNQERRPILDFILHHCKPEDAWQHFRLVDCWRGKIYSVFDTDHPLQFGSRNTFEESALFRIEYLPLPILFTTEDGRSPSVQPIAGRAGGNQGPCEIDYRRKYANQFLINVYHFCQNRSKRDSVETHGDPFSLYVSQDENPDQLLCRIAAKLDMPLRTLSDWKLCFVKEKRVVPVNSSTPLGWQWKEFCSSCTTLNGGGANVDPFICETNPKEPQKMPFLGLEHAKQNKTSRLRGEETVVIRD